MAGRDKEGTALKAHPGFALTCKRSILHSPLSGTHLPTHTHTPHTHSCKHTDVHAQVELELSEGAVQALGADPSHGDHRLSIDICFEDATFGYPLNPSRPPGAPPPFGGGWEAGADAVVFLKMLKKNRG